MCVCGAVVRLPSGEALANPPGHPLAHGLCEGHACSMGLSIDMSSFAVVWDWVPASAITRRRSSALYSAPPPLAELRIGACTSWQAALCLLINRFLCALHSPAMWVEESGR